MERNAHALLESQAIVWLFFWMSWRLINFWLEYLNGNWRLDPRYRSRRAPKRLQWRCLKKWSGCGWGTKQRQIIRRFPGTSIMRGRDFSTSLRFTSCLITTRFFWKISWILPINWCLPDVDDDAFVGNIGWLRLQSPPPGVQPQLLLHIRR